MVVRDSWGGQVARELIHNKSLLSKKIYISAAINILKEGQPSLQLV